MFAFGENIPIIFYNVPLFGHFSWKIERSLNKNGEAEEKRKEEGHGGRFFEEEDGEGLLVADGVYHLRFHFFLGGEVVLFIQTFPLGGFFVFLRMNFQRLYSLLSSHLLLNFVFVFFQRYFLFRRI